jgi:hypothetical protein
VVRGHWFYGLQKTQDWSLVLIECMRGGGAGARKRAAKSAADVALKYT